jgi:phytol kinase
MSWLREALSLPPLETIAWALPLFALGSWTALALAARLKAAGWRTGYTRKTFHFLTFGAAAAVQLGGGRPLLNLFGGATTLVLAYALVRGDGHPLYEALAREKDAPYRTWYIVVPYFATLAGGLCANALAGAAAVVGYLVCGIGDAAGEPIGTRFGRHTYRVPAPGRVVSYRSLEGSAAVALCSWGAVLTALCFLGAPLSLANLGIAAAIAAIAAGIEAIAPHGGDNFFLIVLPALLSRAWLVSS